MAKKPIHKTFQSLLQYYLSMYYQMREENPNIKQDPKKHIHEIEKINRAYLKEIETKYPQWQTDQHTSQLKSDIDFLTQVFTRQEEENQRQQVLKELKESIKKPQQK